MYCVVVKIITATVKRLQIFMYSIFSCQFFRQQKVNEFRPSSEVVICPFVYNTRGDCTQFFFIVAGQTG